MNRSRNRFEGKGVVVTGAAQGIGRAVAKAFAAEGAGLIMLDNEGDVLASTVDAIRGTGADVEAVVGDVSRREDVRRAVERAVERFGRLDAAVQVAGIADFVPFLEFTDESWDKILNVNLRGTWYLVQEAARAMVGAGTRGAIVVTASTNAFQPEAGGLAYNTSKSGQVAVMHTAALELSRHGIRVNALAPGIINTRLSAFVINHPVQSKVFLDRIPIGRFAEPEEMARPILWMCSDDASYLSGHLMVVDGAMTVGLPEPGEMDAPLPGAIR
ncbi:MAG TPA: SDR family NAD(P)-dependent oxidoreductase [Candidatus Nitrosopolaris sp.]|nr:SDR family NAD(P)-dependent oxidoreductase [Candidatus Nitrosopolaris sp.]